MSLYKQGEDIFSTEMGLKINRLNIVKNSITNIMRMSSFNKQRITIEIYKKITRIVYIF